MVDHSKIGKRSKRTGKNYERRTAKLLSEFTSVNFRKTPGSGGFNKHGGISIREELFCGDVICDRPDFQFCIEAKNRQSFSFTAILKNPETAEFSKWWYQCIMDAKAVNLYPMMFFKPDRSADFVALCKEGMDLIDAWNIPHFVLSTYANKILKMRVKYHRKSFEVETVLPVPHIFNWKTLQEYSNPLTFFGE